MSNKFQKDTDIYNDTSSWNVDDFYACYRWFSRLVTKAPRVSFYAQKLNDIDIKRLDEPNKVLLYLLLQEVPSARDILSQTNLEIIDDVKPLRYPVRLSDNPIGIETYRSMGVYL